MLPQHGDDQLQSLRIQGEGLAGKDQGIGAHHIHRQPNQLTE